MSSDSWMKRHNRFFDLIEFARANLEVRRQFLNKIITKDTSLRRLLIRDKLNLLPRNEKKISIGNTIGYQGYMIYYYILVVLLQPDSRIKLFANDICLISKIIPEIDLLIRDGPSMDDAWKSERYHEFEKIRNPEYKHPFVALDTKITAPSTTPSLNFSHMESYPFLLKNFCLSEDECYFVMGL